MSAPLPPARQPSSAGGVFFDVYIVGGESADPSAQMKLAALIASRYRVGAPSVADGLAGGFCLVSKRLEEAAARRLAEELRDLGASPKLQPAGIPLKITVKRAPDGRGRAGGGTKIDAFDRPPSEAGPMQLVEMGARIETVVRQAKVPAEKKGPDMARCPLHGLTYDRARASGCIRCLQPAREKARAIETRFGSGNWRSDPVKRAFVGVGFAVLLGFLPAAYYAGRINGGEVKRLRARQAELSEQPGTKEITDEFDTIDATISTVRGRGLRNTLVLWVMVSGLAGFAWSKLSVPAETED